MKFDLKTVLIVVVVLYFANPQFFEFLTGKMYGKVSGGVKDAGKTDIPPSG